MNDENMKNLTIAYTEHLFSIVDNLILAKLGGSLIK